MKLFSDKLLEMIKKLNLTNIIIDRQNKRYKVEYPRHYTGGKLINVVNFLDTQVKRPDTLTKALSLQFKPVVSSDKTVLAILAWVHKNIRYLPDSVNWKVPEYWAYTKETIEKKSGDCEDGSTLIFVLSRVAGVPAKRIRIVTGNVKVKSRLVGHCWVEYTAEDLNDYILDWCYYYDISSFKMRNASSDMKNYKSYWWKANDLRGFGVRK